MMMRLGDSWLCSNDGCRAQISVQVSGRIDGVNPRCSCGFVMKKTYSSPTFRYLDFLREEDAALVEPASSQRKDK
jgi:hypothetical protein